MNSDEFLQKQAEWKFGKAEAKKEYPNTWFMSSESGHYYPLEGDFDAEVKKIMGTPYVTYLNETSVSMSQKQAELKKT